MAKPRARAKPKFFFEGDNYKLIIDAAKAHNSAYQIKHSNYTLEIISEALNDDGSPLIQAQFLQSLMSKSAIIAANMIKSEIKTLNLEPPEFNKFDLRYNDFTDFDRLKNVNDTIYCIDIKSAYLRVLFNEGLISQGLYNHSQMLPKQDRLAAVGMMAGNKNIWHHNEIGELVDITNEQSEFANYFFLCVSKVNDVMQHIKRILGPTNFIFYWVDGIYFQHEKSRDEIEAYLNEQNFSFTFEKLIKFEVQEIKKRNWISYWQVKEYTNNVDFDKCVQKKFCLPKFDLSVNKQIIEALGLHKDEYSIIKKKITK